VRKNWKGSNSIKARFNLRQDPAPLMTAKDAMAAIMALPEHERQLVITQLSAQGGNVKSPHVRLLQDLTHYAQTLESASLAYCDIHKPGRTDAFASWKSDVGLRKNVIAASEKLRRTRVLAPFLPLLIAARLRFPTEGQRYLELVRLCEVFAFRVFRFHGFRSNAGQSSLFRYGRDLYSGATTIDDVLTSLRGLLLYYSSSQAFHDGFHRADDNWYQWSGLKYFLYEYEEHLAKGEAIRLSWDELERLDLEKTIEHILPQTPVDSYWLDRFTDSARNKWTHDLANLCLTSHNSSYGNKAFPDKKGVLGANYPCYANSNLFMERAIAAFSDWDESSLMARRTALVEWALKRWHVDEVTAVCPTPEDDVADD
jgi:hypothetical protein